MIIGGRMRLDQLQYRREELQQELKEIEAEMLLKSQEGWLGLGFAREETLSHENQDGKWVPVQKKVFHFCVVPISLHVDSSFMFEMPGVDYTVIRSIPLHFIAAQRALVHKDQLGEISFWDPPKETRGTHNKHTIPSFHYYSAFRKENVLEWADALSKELGFETFETPPTPVGEVEDDDEA